MRGGVAMTIDYGAADDEAARRRNGLAASLQTRILVVEDDSDISGLLGRELRGMGHTVDAMRLGADALLATQAADYALLIVDLGLPDLDGLEVVRELRRRL